MQQKHEPHIKVFPNSQGGGRAIGSKSLAAVPVSRLLIEQQNANFSFNFPIGICTGKDVQLIHCQRKHRKYVLE